MSHFNTFIRYILNKIKNSRKPEIETADLSQSQVGLNLSQFQIDCLLSVNSSTTILNYFKLFESVLVIVTTLKNDNICSSR